VTDTYIQFQIDVLLIEQPVEEAEGEEIPAATETARKEQPIDVDSETEELTISCEVARTALILPFTYGHRTDDRYLTHVSACVSLSENFNFFFRN
jgi:hypothetical protein